MTASVLKQDPNTKRFKRTLIYVSMDTQYACFGLVFTACLVLGRLLASIVVA